MPTLSKARVLKLSSAEDPRRTCNFCECDGSFDDLSDCKIRTEALADAGVFPEIIRARHACVKAGVGQLMATLSSTLHGARGAGTTNIEFVS